MQSEAARRLYASYREIFEKENYQTLSASDGQEALDLIYKEYPDLVFMDIMMPRVDGLTALQAIKESGLDIPVVIFTGMGTMQTAIQAIQLGAYEYIIKPLHVEQMLIIARRGLEIHRLASKASGLLPMPMNVGRDEDTLVGDTPVMQKVYKTIGAVAATPNDIPILIVGERGTGKELAARVIHRNGPGAKNPFVSINCTAQSAESLERELFGYEKNAFTGAVDRRIGALSVVDRGTIFLNGIGDIPLYLQQKLFRTIQERAYERLGGNTRLSVRACFVLATHCDLASEVAAGRFYEEFYIKISVVSIHMPPLREHKEDLPQLVNFLLQKLNRKLARRAMALSSEALDILAQYDYPGNVEELEHILERAIIFTTGEVIPPTVLPEELRSSNAIPIVNPDCRKD